MGLGVAWLDVPLGVACLLAGLYHAGLALGRRAPAVAAAGYAVMGFGMAAMFVPAADPVPHAAWVAMFVVSVVWFGIGLVRSGSLFGDAGHHVVGALAMLFMLLAPGHGMGSGLLAPALALALATWFLADIAAMLAHPAPVAVPAPAIAAPMGGPGGALPASTVMEVRGVPVVCLVMNAAMALMLIVMA